MSKMKDMVIEIYDMFQRGMSVFQIRAATGLSYEFIENAIELMGDQLDEDNGPD